MAETNNMLCGKAAAVPAPKVDEVKGTDSKDTLVAAVGRQNIARWQNQSLGDKLELRVSR